MLELIWNYHSPIFNLAYFLSTVEEGKFWKPLIWEKPIDPNLLITQIYGNNPTVVLANSVYAAKLGIYW